MTTIVGTNDTGPDPSLHCSHRATHPSQALRGKSVYFPPHHNSNFLRSGKAGLDSNSHRESSASKKDPLAGCLPAPCKDSMNSECDQPATRTNCHRRRRRHRRHRRHQRHQRRFRCPTPLSKVTHFEVEVVRGVVRQRGLLETLRWPTIAVARRRWVQLLRAPTMVAVASAQLC